MQILGPVLNAWMGMVRTVANSMGYELAVTSSAHRLRTDFRKPKSTSRYVWDPEMYVKGQLYREGYANPIKPIARHNPSLGTRDEIDHWEHSQAQVVGDGGEDADFTEIISSPRFHLEMQQDVISSMLIPSEQWTKLFWALVAVAALVLMTFLLVSFQVFS